MKTILTTLFLTVLSISSMAQKVTPLFGTVTMSQPTCNNFPDGEITITPSGGLQPYTYLWSNGDTTQTISNLSAGIYSVLVTDVVGQTMGGSFSLLNPNPITVEGVVTNTPLNTSNGVIDITNVNNAVGNYTWFWASNNNQTMNQSSLDQTNLKSGGYKIYVTDENGCKGVGYFEVKGFTKPLVNSNFTTNGISNNSSSIQLNNNTTRSNRLESKTVLFPNPSDGNLTIEFADKSESFKIVDINNGEEVMSNNEILKSVEINNLPKGTYTIYITNEGEIETKKITVF